MTKLNVTAVTQTGSNCKTVAIAAVDQYFGELLGFKFFPLHKKNEESFSIRQLVKRHQSMQGELLEIRQVTESIEALGYEHLLVNFSSAEELKDIISENLKQGNLLITFFAVDRTTRDPDSSYDGGNEHAAVINGLDEEILFLTHNDHERQTDIETLYQACKVLPEERELEYYLKCSDNNKKYEIIEELILKEKFSLYKLYPQISILPKTGSGFKQKLIIIKKPNFADHLWKESFLKIRKNLIESVSAIREQGLNLDDLIYLIKESQDTFRGDANYIRNFIIPRVEKHMTRYADSLLDYKQDILNRLINLQHNFESEQFDSNQSKFEEEISSIISSLKDLSKTLLIKSALTSRGCYKRVTEAGYNISSGGHCYGMGNLSAQAFLADEMDNFVRRLNLIKKIPLVDFKNNFSGIKQKIDMLKNLGEVKKACKLREDLLDIEAFFNSLVLLQNPREYQEIFPKQNLYQLRNSFISEIISPCKFDFPKTKPACVFSSVRSFSSDELAKFFQLLKENLGEYSFSLKFSSNDHFINLNFNANTKTWLLIDPNYLPGDEYFNEKYLGKTLFQGFSERSNILVLLTGLEVLGQYEEEVALKINNLMSGKSWQDFYENKEMLNRSNFKKITPLKYSFARQLFLETINLILKGALIEDYLIDSFYESKIIDYDLLINLAQNDGLIALKIAKKFYNHCQIFKLWDKICKEKLLDACARDNSKICNLFEVIAYLIANGYDHAALNLNDFYNLSLRDNKYYSITIRLINLGIISTDADIVYLINQENIGLLELIEKKRKTLDIRHVEIIYATQKTILSQRMYDFLLQEIKIEVGHAFKSRIIAEMRLDWYKNFIKRNVVFNMSNFNLPSKLSEVNLNNIVELIAAGFVIVVEELQHEEILLELLKDIKNVFLIKSKISDLKNILKSIYIDKATHLSREYRDFLLQNNYIGLFQYLVQFGVSFDFTDLKNNSNLNDLNKIYFLSIYDRNYNFTAEQFNVCLRNTSVVVKLAQVSFILDRFKIKPDYLSILHLICKDFISPLQKLMENGLKLNKNYLADACALAQALSSTYKFISEQMICFILSNDKQLSADYVNSLAVKISKLMPEQIEYELRLIMQKNKNYELNKNSWLKRAIQRKDIALLRILSKQITCFKDGDLDLYLSEYSEIVNSKILNFFIKELNLKIKDYTIHQLLEKNDVRLLRLLIKNGISITYDHFFPVFKKIDQDINRDLLDFMISELQFMPPDFIIINQLMLNNIAFVKGLKAHKISITEAHINQAFENLQNSPRWLLKRGAIFFLESFLKSAANNYLQQESALPTVVSTSASIERLKEKAENIDIIKLRRVLKKFNIFTHPQPKHTKVVNNSKCIIEPSSGILFNT